MDEIVEVAHVDAGVSLRLRCDVQTVALQQYSGFMVAVRSRIQGAKANVVFSDCPSNPSALLSVRQILEHNSGKSRGISMLVNTKVTADTKMT